MGKSLCRSAVLFFTTSFLIVQCARDEHAAIYAATSGGIFKSIDGGSGWTSANRGLENIPVFSLAIDRLNPATIYAGTGGQGVFKSTNGGQSWMPASSGLTDPFALSLAIDPFEALKGATG
jgi:hypothetical protein